MTLVEHILSKRRLIVRCRRVLRSECRLVGSQTAKDEAFGFVVPVASVEEQRQIAQNVGTLGVLGAQSCVIDGEGSPVERLGLGEVPSALGEKAEPVETRSRRGMVGAERCLFDGKSSSQCRFCFLESPLVA